MTQENALKLFKCLSDTSRLRIVQSLTQGEMYTELLAERLNLTPSTVSFHMKKLEEAGLAVSRKEQYYTVYSLNRDMLEKTLYEVAVSLSNPLNVNRISLLAFPASVLEREDSQRIVLRAGERHQCAQAEQQSQSPLQHGHSSL